MKSWEPISNSGKFYIQLKPGYIMHEDRRGRRIQYRSVAGAQKAADKLNAQMWLSLVSLKYEARTNRKAIDHINGDITDNRPENLRVVTLPENRK